MLLKFRKQPSYILVKGVLKARCTDNLSSQWEKYAQPESSSWYTVMYVDQCLLSQLVVGNILLHLLMITHDAVELNLNRVSSIHDYSCRLIQLLLGRGSSHSSIREESDAINSNERSSGPILVMVLQKAKCRPSEVFGCIAYAHIATR